ncbi:hypothetical protein CRV08_05650 [Halarcobacter ebronensis]|uniref:Uncharacterized protein n=1 Tax=Halarcobacter ebronensis TaxID=1462615 RepID=A0A4Q0YJ49_9BACT|nr:FecR domain-containing protein [Halarcobacter ebronensis]RXJ68921.1 hypothetical protein CRV08_05650 [Halarcobacter ebronensis]
MNNKTVEEQASYWFACNKENISLEEKHKFRKWLDESNTHKQAYNYLIKIESLCNSLDEKYLDNLIEEAQEGAKKTKFFEYTKKYSFAATLLVLIFFSIFQGINYYSPIYESNLETNILTNQITLLDGTKLEIDAKTKLDVKLYNKQRVVTLYYGQVMFDVAKDKSRPFNIISGQTNIRVVGTAFEVKNLDKITTISVKEGIVKISKIMENDTLQTLALLSKGEKIILDEYGKILNLSTIPIEDIATWKSNYLIFDNTSVKDAIKVFSRYTNDKIKINYKFQEKQLITGQFKNSQIEKFFDSLTTLYPIVVEKKEDTISINKKQ